MAANAPQSAVSRTLRALGLRLLYGVISLLFISFVTFLVDEIAPGDPALTLVGEKGRQEQYLRLRKEMGLNRPWPVRYVEFVGQAARFDFGESLIGVKRPVAEILGQAIPITMRIALYAVLVAAFIGIVLGTLAAVNEGKWFDNLALGFSTLGVTIPNYVLLPILVLIFAVQLDQLPTSWAPANRQIAPEIFYLALPVFVLSLRPMATLTRLMRASMIDALQQEYVRFAVAKGVPPSRIVLRHCFRNAILPVLTMIGTSFGFLLTGSFVVEQAYVIPGIGFITLDAIVKNDTPVILAATFVTGAMFVLVNLAVDLVAPLVDPRIRESQI